MFAVGDDFDCGAYKGCCAYKEKGAYKGQARLPIPKSVHGFSNENRESSSTLDGEDQQFACPFKGQACLQLGTTGLLRIQRTGMFAAGDDSEVCSRIPDSETCLSFQNPFSQPIPVSVHGFLHSRLPNSETCLSFPKTWVELPVILASWGQFRSLSKDSSTDVPHKGRMFHTKDRHVCGWGRFRLRRIQGASYSNNRFRSLFTASSFRDLPVLSKNLGRIACPLSELGNDSEVCPGIPPSTDSPRISHSENCLSF